MVPLLYLCDRQYDNFSLLLPLSSIGYLDELSPYEVSQPSLVFSLSLSLSVVI